MKTFTIHKHPGFRLSAAAAFYAGFTPGSGMAAAATDHLTLVFRLDRTFEAVGVALREQANTLIVEYVGTDDEQAVRAQVSRMLGLDADGDEWLAIGRRDPVVGRLQAEFPGFFTAAKPSPYDAAVWGVISPRMPMRVAAKLKMEMAARHGGAVEVRGRVHHVFPSPRELLAIESFEGISPEKILRLHGVARAAIDGVLDANRLRAVPADHALAALQKLRGVGPWTASHILFRGAAIRDALPMTEPRVLHGVAAAYGIDVPSVATFERMAEQWRPFRMWVCILLARHLHAAGGWNKAEFTRERATAGRRLRSHETPLLSR